MATNGKLTIKDDLEIPAALRRAPASKDQMSYEDLMTLVQQQQAAMTLMQAQLAAKTTLTLKVSEKGAVSLYGMGRFPTTMYAAQWERVLDAADQIRQFIADNKSRLSYK
jgi:hypothetical protein